MTLSSLSGSISLKTCGVGTLISQIHIKTLSNLITLFEHFINAFC